MQTFENWSGSVNFTPTHFYTPTTEQQMQEIISKCAGEKKRVRLIGSLHSFSDVCKTNEVVISLDNYKGIVHFDKEKMLLTVRAGTKIHELSNLAYGLNIAMENLGDIDVQSIAGALSTGTHGTGINYGTLSTQIHALRFINGKSEIVTCSENENRDIFKAAQISLGTLGIVTEYTIKVIPAYKLELKIGKDNIENILGKLDEINQTNRNFEYYWMPHSKVVQTKYSNLTELEAKDNTFSDKMNDFIENYVLNAISMPTRYVKGLGPTLGKMLGLFVSNSTKVNWSHKVYATQRLVRFNEMEYNVPYEAFPEVQREVMRVFKQKNIDIHFPTENRFVKEDDIWLSPAYNRKSGYMAFHSFKGTAYKAYFQLMQDICLQYDGRPHWGKMHTLKADKLSTFYPKWNDFLAVRAVQDPDKIFISDYLAEVLGL